MLKSLLKQVRKRLLKFDCIKRAVSDYCLRQKKERHRKTWAKLLHAGCTVRELSPEKLKIYDTLATVTDDGVLVEYMNGREVAQKHVDPVFIDSTNWGVDKFGS